MPQKKIKKSVTSQDGFFIKGKLPHHNDEAHGVRYKKPFYLGAFFGIFYLLSYTIPLLGLIYFLQNKSLHGLKVFGVGVILFLAILLISFLVKSQARCPLCRGMSLITGKNKKNKKAFKVFPLSYGSTSCCTIILGRRYRCHHCGTPFSLRPKHKNQ